VANILAVDDSRTMRDMVTHTLESVGHQVTGAADGEEGLAQARRGRFDLVLTDVNMPRKDGITLVRDLRALPAYRHTPILVLTTEGGGDMKTKGRAAGATGWLVKPFDPQKLLAVLGKVLG
jgi:two-component system, chemotaxis family, chemotaxis protein CheY